MKRFVLVHYGEIGLKGANAEYFQVKLAKRLKLKLVEKFGGNFQITHTLRRFLIDLPKNFNEDEWVGVLRKIPGIQNFKFVCENGMDLEELGEDILWQLDKEGSTKASQASTLRYKVSSETFRVKVKRSMEMDLTSVEIERKLGGILLKKGIGLKAKMKNADLVIDLEFFNDRAYFSFHTYKGMGGLSAGSQSKLVALISAGIDSPVAAYRMMKRGAKIIFVHFHGYPYTGTEEMDQVKQLVEILSSFQVNTKLYLMPFGQVQKRISTIVKIPEKIRTVLYRRMMLRIAQKVAYRENARGLITGDSFGQVASQTPDNLFAIHDASFIPLYQPLISFDKEEIVKISQEIGTFEISKLPCKDSCVLFAPEKPELKASLKNVHKYEEYLEVEVLVEKVFKEREIVNF